MRKFLYKKHREIINHAKQTGKPVPYYLLIPEKTRKMMIAQNSGRKEMQSFSASQSLRQKFLTSAFNDMSRGEEECMRDFCAGLI